MQAANASLYATFAALSHSDPKETHSPVPGIWIKPFARPIINRKKSRIIQSYQKRSRALFCHPSRNSTARRSSWNALIATSLWICHFFSKRVSGEDSCCTLRRLSLTPAAPPQDQPTCTYHRRSCQRSSNDRRRSETPARLQW